MSSGYVSGAGDTAPWFFLSYAHTPQHPSDPGDPDAWVFNLFRDLCAHIMQLTNLPPGQAGFMDRELRTGHNWPVQLAHALATCRVFVPLYSRRYFDSEQCGKEWFAFSRRLVNHAARGEEEADAIIPALWVPVDAAALPEVARSIQFNHHELGDRYGTHGFYGIIKLSRYRSDYEVAVYELARRIVEVATRSHMEPEHPADYGSLASAFGSGEQHVPGDHRLRLIVVSLAAGHLPAGRSRVYYGQSAVDWNPYHPDSVRSLAAHAAELARNLGYRPDIGDLDEHYGSLISSAPPTGPGVMLVDVWAVARPDYLDKLRGFDVLDKPWIQVMVPWNYRDTETAEAERKLRQNLEVALARKLAEGRVTCRQAVSGIPALEDFSDVLPTMVRTAARQYLRHAQAFPPPGPVIEKPRLSWPVTDSPNPEHGDD